MENNTELDKRNIEALNELAFNLRCIHTMLRIIHDFKYSSARNGLSMGINRAALSNGIEKLARLANDIEASSSEYETYLDYTTKNYKYTEDYLSEYSRRDAFHIADLYETVTTEAEYTKLCKRLEELVTKVVDIEINSIQPTGSYNQYSEVRLSTKDLEIKLLRKNIGRRLEDTFTALLISDYFIPKTKNSPSFR